MPPDDSALRDVTDFVWTTFLRADLTPSIPPSNVEPGYVGRVRISGTWSGELTLACSDTLARRAAGTLFDVPPDAVTGDDVNDAVGEIANVMSGNVKALLPAPSRLSLPDVYAGTVGATRADDRVREVWFTCEGEPLVVRLAVESQPAS